MAFETSQIRFGNFTAQVDLSSWQFKPVKIGTTGTIDKCDATTDIPFGILQNDPVAGASAMVCTFGVSKVIAGETLVMGEIVGTQVTSGEVITAATTMYPIGTVLEIAADGETATIMVNPSNTVKA
jgi:hypothetical protein